MNVGIGNEAAQFYFLGIFVSNFRYSVFEVYLPNACSLTGAAQLRASGNASCLLLAATQPVLTIYDSRPKTEGLLKELDWFWSPNFFTLYVLLLNE
jgi:hypothetical protein